MPLRSVLSPQVVLLSLSDLLQFFMHEVPFQHFTQHTVPSSSQGPHWHYQCPVMSMILLLTNHTTASWQFVRTAYSNTVLTVCIMTYADGLIRQLDDHYLMINIRYPNTSLHGNLTTPSTATIRHLKDAYTQPDFIVQSSPHLFLYSC